MHIVDRRSIIQQRRDLSNLHKRILLYLLDHEDDDGLIRVHQSTIAEALGLKQSSVNRCLRKLPLFSRDLVIWAQRDESSPRYRGNVYWFRNEFAANPQNRDRSTLHAGNGS